MAELQKENIRRRAYNFSLSIIYYCQTLPIKNIYQILLNQLLRASTSIGANLVEAKGASSKKDFIKYFDIALKSANESQYWLCLLRDSKLKEIDKKNTQKLLSESDEICKIIAKSLLTMKGKV